MHRPRALIALLTLLTVFAVAACAEGAATTAPPTPEPAPDATTPTDAAPDVGESGEVMVFIREVDASGSPVRLVVDRIEMLSGPEAVEAAHEDGQLDPAEDSLPNDFYIRNLDEATEELTAADGVVILPISIVGEPEPTPWTPQELAQMVADGTGPAVSPYLLTLVDGEVTQIQEVYIP